MRIVKHDWHKTWVPFLWSRCTSVHPYGGGIYDMWYDYRFSVKMPE